VTPRRLTTRVFPLIATWVISTVIIAGAMQLGERPFSGDPTHPAIEYQSRPLTDVVTHLQKQLEQGDAHLAFDSATGYLRSVLDALQIPVSSQILVFSKTGVQGVFTSPANPRALYFNDSVIVGYVRHAPALEVAVQDPQQGVVFFTTENQRPVDRPSFSRGAICLSCHLSYNSLDVPGLLDRSMFTAPTGAALPQLGSFLIDHHSPLSERWGGYYVTGTHGAMRHMGNAAVTDREHPESMITSATLNVTSLEGKLDFEGYLTSTSDIVSLLVFDHQTHVMNLLTRVGWEVRVASYDHNLDVEHGPIADAVKELVDYLLFVNEAPLTARIRGTSGFAEAFAARGPRDRQGRSLRDLDLEHRLMRYPCSYMIYASAFDELPTEARQAIYRRMWEVLSGQSREARLSREDREAVIEILRDTKADLPSFFQPLK